MQTKVKPALEAALAKAGEFDEVIVIGLTKDPDHLLWCSSSEMDPKTFLTMLYRASAYIQSGDKDITHA